MFYIENDKMSESLRFGDVIRNIPVCYPIINHPISEGTYNIHIDSSDLLVVLSPCCSISDKILLLAPLIHLNAAIYKNQYLADNVLRINDLVQAKDSLPPIAWDNMVEAEKIERLSKSPAYVFLDIFIYMAHSTFDEYTIKGKDINVNSRYYAIDFRTAFRIHCDKIGNPKFSLGESKLLQLSLETRNLLRRKIASFYTRIPEEDIAFVAP